MQRRARLPQPPHRAGDEVAIWQMSHCGASGAEEDGRPARCPTGDGPTEGQANRRHRHVDAADIVSVSTHTAPPSRSSSADGALAAPMATCTATEDLPKTHCAHTASGLVTPSVAATVVRRRVSFREEPDDMCAPKRDMSAYAQTLAACAHALASHAAREQALSTRQRQKISQRRRAVADMYTAVARREREQKSMEQVVLNESPPAGKSTFHAIGADLPIGRAASRAHSASAPSTAPTVRVSLRPVATVDAAPAHSPLTPPPLPADPVPDPGSASSSRSPLMLEKTPPRVRPASPLANPPSALLAGTSPPQRQHYTADRTWDRPLRKPEVLPSSRFGPLSEVASSGLNLSTEALLLQPLRNPVQCPFTARSVLQSGRPCPAVVPAALVDDHARLVLLRGTFRLMRLAAHCRWLEHRRGRASLRDTWARWIHRTRGVRMAAVVADRFRLATLVRLFAQRCVVRSKACAADVHQRSVFLQRALSRWRVRASQSRHVGPLQLHHARTLQRQVICVWREAAMAARWRRLHCLRRAVGRWRRSLGAVRMARAVGAAADEHAGRLALQWWHRASAADMASVQIPGARALLLGGALRRWRGRFLERAALRQAEGLYERTLRMRCWYAWRARRTVKRSFPL